MNESIEHTVVVLDYDPLTGKFTPRESAYAGPVSAKAWRGINALFLREHAAGRFYPADPADAYQRAILEAETAAEKIAAGMTLKDGVSADTYVIAAAKLAMLNHCERKVLPTREEHAAVEDGRVSELRVRAPLHVRAEYALNFLSELCERILATDRKLGETVVLAFAAYIVCDGNFAAACKLAHISRDRWYRDWPLWCRWARAAARERSR